MEIAKDVFGLVWDEDDSVYGGYGANQGFVILEESVLVFDTGFTNVQVSRLLASVRKVTDKKIRYIVNSHDHSDHVFGNFYLVRHLKDAIIVSQEICKSRLLDLGSKRLADYRSRDSRLRGLLGEVKITLPNLTYSELNLKINIEGTQMFLVHPETGAHTLGDTMILLPRKNVIFAGDILWNGFLPNLEDANLEGWINTLSNIDTTGYRKLLPGHGKVCSRKEVDVFLDYLKKVLENLRNIDNPLKDEVSKLRNCFAIEGTEIWKMRGIIDWNIEKVLGRSIVG